MGTTNNADDPVQAENMALEEAAHTATEMMRLLTV